MKKKFLISIDTEGDNLWGWKFGESITTENSLYLPRFQALCDKYGFKPTYLTNYEMVLDERFVKFAKKIYEQGNCEIGMHLHAWNSPPDYELFPRKDGMKVGHPYLIEYPTDIMESKISFMTDLLTERFEARPITHRAGRWATNAQYFHILNKYSYKVDCSVTPGMSWEKTCGYTEGSVGTDYLDYPTEPFKINQTNIWEVPVTVLENHRIHKDGYRSIKHILGNYYKAAKGYGKIWLRPNGNNLEDMLYLADKVYHSKSDYLMFMLHSSEFMPGGSWAFPTEESIEKLYDDLSILFKYISTMYEGETIGNYGASRE